MPHPFYYHHAVLAEEIDPQGHANNVAYVQWMQQAALEHSAAQSWPGERYREHGWSWVVRKHAIEYRRPAFVGEAITVVTWVADMNRFTSLRKYEIRRGDELLARAQTNWAFVDIRNGRLMPIPEAVSKDFTVGEFGCDAAV